jgi:hypothetical protein
LCFVSGTRVHATSDARGGSLNGIPTTREFRENAINEVPAHVVAVLFRYIALLTELIHSLTGLFLLLLQRLKDVRVLGLNTGSLQRTPNLILPFRQSFLRFNRIRRFSGVINPRLSRITDSRPVI